MSFIETIRTYGVVGLAYCAEVPSEHAKAIELAQKEYPALYQLIGKHVVTVGSGWSIGLAVRYTLTMEGIDQVVQLLKIRAVVAPRIEQIQELVATLDEKEPRALITTENSLKTFLGMKADQELIHAVSVFIQKKQGRMQVFINDSLANKYVLDAKKDPIDLFATCVKRQESRESTCGTFAITDCIAFQEDPDLIDKIVQLNGNLPNSMKTLDLVGARKRTIDFEILLIEAEMGKELSARAAG